MLNINHSKSPIELRVEVPASKSISNRLLILQQTSTIPFHISNLSHSEDTCLLNDLLNKIEEHHSVEPLMLQCENCGTAYRFLCAYLANKEGTWILDGSPRMQQRPIKALVDTLIKAGAEIRYLNNSGFPPLEIKGKKLQTNFWKIDSQQSSQYVSAIAMLLPMMGQNAEIHFSTKEASLQYIDMTIGIMQMTGIDIARKDATIKYVHTDTIANPLSIVVEYDWSAAAVWFVIAALSSETNIFIKGLQKSTLQADSIITQWMSDFGVETAFLTDGVQITKRQHRQPKELLLDCGNNLDLVPYIAVLCVGLKIDAQLQNVANLMIKESNRIEALQTELGKLATVDYRNNNLIINPKQEQFPDTIHFSSHDDHRIAMSLSALSCCISNIYIYNETCVNKSYPDFWKNLIIQKKQ